MLTVQHHFHWSIWCCLIVASIILSRCWRVHKNPIFVSVALWGYFEVFSFCRSLMPQSYDHQYAQRISFSSSNQHNKDTLIQIKKVSSHFLTTARWAASHRLMTDRRNWHLCFQFHLFWELFYCLSCEKHKSPNLTKDVPKYARMWACLSLYEKLLKVVSWSKWRKHTFSSNIKDHLAGPCTLCPIDTEYNTECFYSSWTKANILYKWNKGDNFMSLFQPSDTSPT